MYSENQLRELHDYVFTAMVGAGWLRSFTYTVGKGHLPIWTPEGLRKAATLRRIALTFGLQGDDRLPHAFDKVCRGQSLDVAEFPFVFPDIDVAIRAGWVQFADELKMVHNEDSLLVLVNVLNAWVPDLD